MVFATVTQTLGMAEGSSLQPPSTSTVTEVEDARVNSIFHFLDVSCIIAHIL